MTPKQAIFYGEFIKDSNAARAARVATGCSVESSAVIGARLLRNVKVAAAVEAWKSRQVEKHELTADRILVELKKLALFDPGHLYDHEGKPIPVAQLDDYTRAAVAAVDDSSTETVAEDGTKTVVRNQRVKFADRIRACELLGRHFQLFPTKIEASGPGGGPIPVDAEIRVVFVRPEDAKVA